jgi:hypothetical protein
MGVVGLRKEYTDCIVDTNGRLASRGTSQKVKLDTPSLPNTAEEVNTKHIASMRSVYNARIVYGDVCV